jgi:hypothetical protein
MKKFFAVGLAVLVLAASASAQDQERRLINDLKQIGLAYHNYFDTNRKGPARAEDLDKYLENDARLTGLLKSGDVVFAYNVGILDMKQGTSNTVLAYPRDVKSKGGPVLMGDGSVRKMTADQFAKAIIAKPKDK